MVGAGCQREHAGAQQLNDVGRVGGGEFVGLDEVPGDRDAEGDGADDRGPQVRVVGGDGLGDLRLVAGAAALAALAAWGWSASSATGPATPGWLARRLASVARICSADCAGVPLTSGTGRGRHLPVTAKSGCAAGRRRVIVTAC